MNNVCIHHWIIEIPNGSKSKGRCKNCKAVREFHNVWGNDVWAQNKNATARTLTPDELGLELGV